ncbi:MAG: RNA-binding transcriptional accessory protein [Flavobacteriales bacterium]|nr:RNA-binding transcriptional accessory protein [Flavobacteriales bacterium]
MNVDLIGMIAARLQLTPSRVRNTVDLLQGGATVPFISRYRKEATGGMDEVAVANVQSTFLQLQELQKRKETILHAIDEQGQLTPDLRAKLEATWDANVLEDLYLPYKQKRKTKAEAARKKGLEPLAKMIMAQKDGGVRTRVRDFVKGDVGSEDEAVQGAKDIMAEWVNESSGARNALRKVFDRSAVLTSKVIKGKETEGEKFRDYFQVEEKLKRCKSHRLLAMRRGEKEGVLRVTVRPPEEEAIEALNRIFIKNDITGWVGEAVREAYKRLLAPSIENEFAAASKQQADEEAIKVFAENLRQLLLGAPLGEKRVLAIDPGFRTGCKLVCLDEKGDVLYNETVYPHAPQNQKSQAMKKVSSLIEAYHIEAVAIGNGTAGRETEDLIGRMRFNSDIEVYVVSEAGASVYSASSVAREELPQYDVTVRGAVSIGRRLMDPLAELVKIDPKSIGVGQYQHDVDQKQLQQSLDRVVESCVNNVGVDINTASKHLLAYVSGLGPQLAKNIVEHRSSEGAFSSREDLKKVPRLGEKVFEQCAGFLRIRDGKNPLDNSAVHPESYAIVKKMARTLSCDVQDLLRNETLIGQLTAEDFISDGVGPETLQDILAELGKPGLDPRKKAKAFAFAKDIHKVSDLQVGMVLPGIITNITNFGVFVDVGVKQDGLVHISNLANEYVSNPADHVHLHQQVQVKVLEVDVDRKRIGLSMKDVGS